MESEIIHIQGQPSFKRREAHRGTKGPFSKARGAHFFSPQCVRCVWSL